MKNKTRVKMTYVWGFILILAGLLLNYFNVGNPNFKIFGGIGNWFIYIGFVGLIIATVRLLSRKKERKIDERMEFVATKALRITFLFLILGTFIVMIIDGVKTINTPYHLFMSYMICLLLIVYFIAYKILLNKN